MIKKLKKLLTAVAMGLGLFCAPPAQAQNAQGTGWAFVQDSPLIFCQGSGRTSCNPGLGQITPTVAGSVWILQTQSPNNVSIASINPGNGGGTWIHANHVTNPSGFTADTWYNLTGNAGFVMASPFGFTLTGSAGNFFGANFVELLPPPGSTASLDVAGTSTPTNCTTCAAPTLTLTATDAVWVNPGGAGNLNFKSWSAPYITTSNGSGLGLNIPAGVTSTTNTFTGTSNPEFTALAFKSSFGSFTPPVLQYQLVNVTAVDPPIGCSNCTITIPATTAGNLLVLNAANEAGSFLTSVSGGGTWTVPAACQVKLVVQGQNNALSCAYNLNASGGTTSLSITFPGVAAQGFAVSEFKSLTGGLWNLDAVGATQNLPNSSCSGFCFPGQALSLNGVNDVIVQNAWIVGQNPTGPNFYAQPSIPSTAQGANGPGAFNAFAFQNASIAILTDTGLTAPQGTWINAVNNQNTFVNALAFYAAPQSITAADCNSGSIATALGQVTVDGALVIIPSGTCSYASTLSYTVNHSTIIKGQSTVTGSCHVGGTCTATDNTTISVAGASPAWSITQVVGHSIRISGISFVWSSGAQQFNGMLQVRGTNDLGHQFRIDHSHFVHANIVDLLLHGSTGPLYGVVDHNLFNAGQSNEDMFRVEHPNWSGNEPATTPGYSDGLGNSSWADDAHWGSGRFIFEEDNFFTFDPALTGGAHAFAFDCTALGGRMVFRDNTLTVGMAMQVHGTGSGDANFRTCRAMDIYDNSFIFSSSPGTFNFAQLLELEGGGLYWHGNTSSGYLKAIQNDYIRSTNATYSQVATPNGWGYCLSSPLVGVPGPSPWDNNLAYPCMDQTGRGKGDLITGCFLGPGGTCPNPTKVDSVSNSIQFPNQVLDIAYGWGNSISLVPSNPTHYFVSTSGSQVTVGRDIMLELPNIDNAAAFNGTTGTGCGPLAGNECLNPVAQPGTCSPGVGYWNPASGPQGTLFVCGNSNNFVQTYQPFTYPHTVVQGAATSTLAPPTNLHVTPNVLPTFFLF